MKKYLPYGIILGKPILFLSIFILAGTSFYLIYRYIQGEPFQKAGGKPDFTPEQATPQKAIAEKMIQGCLGGKDCIPAIKDPKFVSAQEAEKFLSGADVIFGISIEGDVRAYPQKILNLHEIVNDTVGEKPVIVTFCPLCFTGIAYERTLNTQVVQFGVSGKLIYNNLVMYDSATETLWSQITGEAIAGPLTGQKLVQVPISSTTWENWKKEHPETKVLSNDQGIYPSSVYETYPYGDYETDPAPLFPVDTKDDRLGNKERVWGIALEGTAKAYKDSDLAAGASIKDKVGEVNIEISKAADGTVTAKNLDKNEPLEISLSFWFAWVNFYPETEIYKP